jgi:O-antigen/teichoic acid export membrane protein
LTLLASDRPARVFPRSLGDLAALVKDWLARRDDRSLAQRVAGTAFLIRVGNAGLAFVTQVALARFMGSHEFGIYVYVWTWLLVIGGIVDLGLSASAQRFVPEYAERGALSELRGFIRGARLLSFTLATVLALLGAGIVWLLDNFLDGYTVVPLYIACAALPVFAVMHAQDGIARSYNWINVALLPPYILRQLVLLALIAGAYLAGLAVDARTAIAAAALSIWITGLGQTIVLNRKLKSALAPGPKAYEFGRWIVISLPMFAVDALYFLLMYVDVLVLKQFRSPDEIAIYYAATKTLALVTFVYFAVAAAASHKFTEYYVAGDRERLKSFVADAIRWTFWPSLAAIAVMLALGWPMLWLFGPKFVAGYNLMFILAIGLLARAAVGPGERFLNMLGQQRACATIAATTFCVNLGLCLLLIPSYGVEGAAVAMSAAFVVESILLYLAARQRLGFHLFIFGRPA